MTKNDWYDAGDQIKKLVQDAIDSQDFSQLSNTITNVVNQTVDGLQSAIKENINGASQRNKYEYTNAEAADRIRSRMQKREKQSETGDGRERHRETEKPPRVSRAKLKVPGEITGRVMKWYGYSVGSMLGLALGILGVIAVTTGFGIAVPGGILALLCATHLAIGVGGSKRLGLASRYRRYKAVLGERTYCLIEELSSAVGQSSKYVRKDIKHMIQKGFFKEGRLAQKDTLLITDQSTYQQYLQTQTEYVHREALREEDKKNGNDKKKEDERSWEEEAGKQAKNLTPECRDLIREGKVYIRHVHECNERIPDSEMSAKLDRLELVITRIFREVEKNPDVAGDMKKMMSYYLPTTKKLLDAYCEMDAQPISGQNIDNTKKEIEASLDTINKAFENLLDSFFEETAWDISSDITVLQTMLAQEGLTGKDFQ